MTRVTLSEVRARLEELVPEAAAGGEVVIEGKDISPAVVMHLLVQPPEGAAAEPSRWDLVKHVPPVWFKMADDFDEPLEDFAAYRQ